MVRLHLIRVERVAFDRAGDLPQTRPHDHQGVHIDVDLGSEIETSSGDRRLAYRVSLRLHTIPDASFFRSESVFRVVYLVDPSGPSIVSKERVDAFGRLTVLPDVWPYWRELLQSMTARMGLPPLTLPLYDPRLFARGQ